MLRNTGPARTLALRNTFEPFSTPPPRHYASGYRGGPFSASFRGTKTATPQRETDRMIIETSTRGPNVARAIGVLLSVGAASACSATAAPGSPDARDSGQNDATVDATTDSESTDAAEASLEGSQSEATTGAPVDAPGDAPVDAPGYAPVDAPIDAPPDSQAEPSVDAIADANDAAADGPTLDAPMDAIADAATDPVVDAPVDASLVDAPAPTWAKTTGRFTAIGSGWAIGTAPIGAPGNYVVERWDPVMQQWVQAPGGGSAVSVDLNGIPWLVNAAGQIFRWLGGNWGLFGTMDFCATSVASGAKDTETWAIHCGDATIWRWNGSAWDEPDAGVSATKIAVFSAPDPTCGDHLPMVMGAMGDMSIHAYVHTTSCGSGVFQAGTGSAYDLSTDFAVWTDGTIQRWNAGTSTWQHFVAAPWGTNTKIGTWANGVFAMSAATDATNGAVQMLVGYP